MAAERIAQASASLRNARRYSARPEAATPCVTVDALTTGPDGPPAIHAPANRK